MLRRCGMKKTILVASGKGGAGKTTVSALLGEAFAFGGDKVLIIELDSGLRSLDVALGVTKNLLFDFGDIVRSGCKIEDAAMPCPFCKNLSVICASAKNMEFSGDDLKKITESCFAFDYVIFDCPAGIGSTLENAAAVSDMALIIATPDPSSVRAARNTSLLIEKCGLKNRRLIIERCPDKPQKLAPLKNLDEMIDGTELQLIGVIREDPLVRRAIDSGAALTNESVNYKAFRNIAERISGKQIPLGFK